MENLKSPQKWGRSFGQKEFEQILHVVLLFPLLTLNKWMLAGNVVIGKSQYLCIDSSCLRQRIYSDFLKTIPVVEFIDK